MTAGRQGCPSSVWISDVHALAGWLFVSWQVAAVYMRVHGMLGPCATGVPGTNAPYETQRTWNKAADVMATILGDVALD